LKGFAVVFEVSPRFFAGDQNTNSLLAEAEQDKIRDLLRRSCLNVPTLGYNKARL